MKRPGHLIISILQIHLLAQQALAGPLETASAHAGVQFDNLALSNKVVDARGMVSSPHLIAPAPAGLAHDIKNPGAAMKSLPPPIQPDIWGPGKVPVAYGDQPVGIGPVSRERSPSYLKGLLGGLLGLLLAPIAFALEVVQAVALTPVRMVKNLLQGDVLGFFGEPLRTAKNLVQDAALTGLGMLNSAAAPVWNAFRPDEATDFIYANNRLMFIGGPVGAIQKSMNVAAFAPSWHTVFPSRQYGLDIYHHEFVHNEQWKKSYAWEHIGEDYRGYKDWDAGSVRNYLNW